MSNQELAKEPYKPIITSNQQLAEKPYKPNIIKFKKKKYALIVIFTGNIYDGDLADMQLISKFNIGFKFLLCVINIFSKYASVIPWKDRKVLQLIMLSK